MPERNYLNVATPVVLTAFISAGASELPVGNTSAFPEPPFTLGIERGTSKEEFVLCTAKTLTAFTVQRGFDGTTAVSHNQGALVEHTVGAIDYREAGVPRLTIAERNALSGVKLWVGRVIFNTTSNVLQVNTPSGWVNVGPRAGTVDAVITAAAPQGTLRCDGQTVSRTTFADLNAVMAAAGYPFGAGDGETTFNLPRLNGAGGQPSRMIIGTDPTEEAIDAVGKVTGDFDHSHSGPSHTHSTGNHTHTVSSHAHTNPNTGSAGAHTHSQGNTGSGGPTSTAGATVGSSHAPGTAGEHTSGLQARNDIRHSHTGTNVYDPGLNAKQHTHSISSHTHSNPTSGSSGAHTHSQGNTGGSGTLTTSSVTAGSTGAAGTGSTGVGNPPVMALTWVIYV